MTNALTRLIEDEKGADNTVFLFGGRKKGFYMG
jgi:hypothetical protein